MSRATTADDTLRDTIRAQAERLGRLEVALAAIAALAPDTAPNGDPCPGCDLCRAIAARALGTPDRAELT